MRHVQTIFDILYVARHQELSVGFSANHNRDCISIYLLNNNILYYIIR